MIARTTRNPQASFTPLLLLTGLLVAVALLAPLVAPYTPDAVDLTVRRQPPSAVHLFGTELPFVRWPRGIALALLDALPPAKRAFTRAMLFGVR